MRLPTAIDTQRPASYTGAVNPLSTQETSGGVMAMNRLSRHLVYGCRGMICSNSPLAASAGLKILQEGGNAFDAALAVAATESVTIVPACGLGGDAFILLHDAATGRITGINSSGV